MTIWKRGHLSQGPKAKARRQGALMRLQEQTKDFDKIVNNSYLKQRPSFPLYSEHDKKRITKEIAILKERV